MFNGDESRYLQFAKNILNGYYSPPYPNIDLMNGPGYPLVLVPFLAVGLPITFLILINAFFYYFSIVFLFKSLIEFVSFKKSLVLSLFWAFYYNVYQELVKLLTEPLTCLLITLILFYLVKLFQNDDRKSFKKYILISGVCIGYLALTKISFGYVLMFLLAGSISILIFNKRNSNLKKLVIVLVMALAFTTPYLIYTYNLTGKIFYWGTPGGDSLYWMSTPFKNEYGNWYGDFNLLPRSQKEIDRNVPGYLDSLKLHHQKDYDKIFDYPDVIKREKMFKKIAIENIKSNPLKYLDNCISNVGRLLFSFPYSYTIQSNRTLFRLPLNGALVLISIFSLIPTFFNWKRLFFPIKFILFFLFLYLGASVLVN
jgi:hypothetical protein